MTKIIIPENLRLKRKSEAYINYQYMTISVKREIDRSERVIIELITIFFFELI